MWPGKNSRGSALHLKKTVLRYALLSLALCLTRISAPFRDELSTPKDFVKKKLLTKFEENLLRVR